MATKKFLVLAVAVLLLSACASPVAATPASDFDATVNAIVQTALANVTPMATPTAMFTATPAETATPASIATPGGWCANRWSVNCPTTWSEVLAIWPKVKTAYKAYGIQFSLSATEPAKVYATGSWWVTSCAGGFSGDKCVQPLAGYDTIAPKDAQNVWDVRWHGNCRYVIFTACGNLGRQCIAVPTNTPVPDRPSDPEPTPTSGCPEWGCLTPTPPVVPTWTPPPPTATSCPICDLATPTTPP